MADPFQPQDSNSNAWVGVREGFHKDTQQQHTEFLIQDKDAHERIHLGIDLQGNEIYRTPWHK